jgi:hypothetical protein
VWLDELHQARRGHEQFHRLRENFAASLLPLASVPGICKTEMVHQHHSFAAVNGSGM